MNISGKMKRILTSIAAVCIAIAASAQQGQPIPIDPAVRIGHLDNGLTYYIRHHEEPKGQANFYIAQKVGSILEDEDQRGLAHFLEHMCFNGTEHFPDNSSSKSPATPVNIRQPDAKNSDAAATPPAAKNPLRVRVITNIPP